jgi:hypothetical protein
LACFNRTLARQRTDAKESIVVDRHHQAASETGRRPAAQRESSRAVRRARGASTSSSKRSVKMRRPQRELRRGENAGRAAQVDPAVQPSANQTGDAYIGYELV